MRCHGANKRKGKLRLHTLEDATTGGKEHGAGIVPGKPEESSLYVQLTIDPENDEDEELMPPADEGGPLPKAQIELVRRWIEAGAVWPDGVELVEPEEDED